MKYTWDINKIKNLVATSINFTEVLEGLQIPRQGNNIKTLKSILSKNHIDYSHFTSRARHYNTKHVDIQDYLSNSKFIGTNKLKHKLLKLGIKENKCEKCGITSWNGQPLVMQLHHINGNNKDNRLENLQMLCPNCHSQTDNYCGSAQEKKHNYCKDCGREITRSAKYCVVCSAKHHRKVVMPSKEELIMCFRQFKNFSKVAQSYGVTDNSVRKWFKKYGLPYRSKEVKKLLGIQ